MNKAAHTHTHTHTHTLTPFMVKPHTVSSLSPVLFISSSLPFCSVCLLMMSCADMHLFTNSGHHFTAGSSSNFYQSVGVSMFLSLFLKSTLISYSFHKSLRGVAPFGLGFVCLCSPTCPFPHKIYSLQELRWSIFFMVCLALNTSCFPSALVNVNPTDLLSSIPSSAPDPQHHLLSTVMNKTHTGVSAWSSY